MKKKTMKREQQIHEFDIVIAVVLLDQHSIFDTIILQQKGQEQPSTYVHQSHQIIQIFHCVPPKHNQIVV